MIAMDTTTLAPADLGLTLAQMHEALSLSQIQDRHDPHVRRILDHARRRWAALWWEEGPDGAQRFQLFEMRRVARPPSLDLKPSGPRGFRRSSIVGLHVSGPDGAGYVVGNVTVWVEAR